MDPDQRVVAQKFNVQWDAAFHRLNLIVFHTLILILAMYKCVTHGNMSQFSSVFTIFIYPFIHTLNCHFCHIHKVQMAKIQYILPLYFMGQVFISSTLTAFCLKSKKDCDPSTSIIIQNCLL